MVSSKIFLGVLFLGMLRNDFAWGTSQVEEVGANPFVPIEGLLASSITDPSLEPSEQLLAHLLLVEMLTESSPLSAYQYHQMAKRKLTPHPHLKTLLTFHEAKILKELNYLAAAKEMFEDLVEKNRLTSAQKSESLGFLLSVALEEKDEAAILRLLQKYTAHEIRWDQIKSYDLPVLSKSLGKWSMKNQEHYLYDLLGSTYGDAIGLWAFKNLFSKCDGRTHQDLDHEVIDHIRHIGQLDNGMRAFLAERIRRPYQELFLADQIKVEGFFKLQTARFHEEAVEFGLELDETKIKDPYQRKRFLLQMVRTFESLGRYDDANRYLWKLHHMGVNVKGRFARLLYYRGNFKEAAQVFYHLSEKVSLKRYAWHGLWTAYLAKDDSKVINIYRRCERYRCFSLGSRLKAKFWYARALLRTDQEKEGFQLLDEILAQASESYYAEAIRTLYPNRSPKVSITPRLAKEEALVPSLLAKNLNAFKAETGQRYLAASYPHVGSYINRMISTSNEAEELGIISELADSMGYYRLGRRAQYHLNRRFLSPSAGDIEEGQVDLERMRHLYPQAFRDIVESASLQNKTDPLLIYSIMRAESFYDVSAVSPVGARGLLQMMPYTALKLAKKKSLKDFKPAKLPYPYINIPLAVSYFAFLKDHFKGNIVLALTAYNAGPESAHRWLNRCGGCSPLEYIDLIGFSETRNYVKKILGYYSHYQKLYGTEQRLAFAPLPNVALKAGLF